MTDKCYHCNLDNPLGSDFRLKILDEKRRFCCPGCLAVAEMICNSGQSDFYRFRTQPSNKPNSLLPNELDAFKAFDDSDITAQVSQEFSEYKKLSLGIEGITCAACGWLIKQQLIKHDGVISVEINTVTKKADVKLKPTYAISKVFEVIRQLGYSAYPYTDDAATEHSKKENKDYLKRIIVAGLAMMQVMMFSTGLYLGEYQDIALEHAYFLNVVSGILATPVVFYSAQPFFRSAIQNLRFRRLGMNMPVSIAILSAYGASMYSLLSNGQVYYFDSVVMFTFFLLFGRYLEQRIRLKAILKQQDFKKLLPVFANIVNEDKHKSPKAIPVSEIKVGDKILIHAGGVIPVDGKLISNIAKIDESIITGESLPIEKQHGQPIFSGSTNNSNSIYIEATSLVSNSRLQRFTQLQNESTNLDSTRASLADKVASFYVFGLFILAFFVGLYWFYEAPNRVFPIILSLLVISCPCALSLATPAAVAATISNLSDKGFVLKTNNCLSKLASITHIVFDKTGTLTLGKPSISQVTIYTGLDQEACLNLASSMEAISDHPISQAFKASDALITFDHLEALNNGIAASLDGDSFRLGNLSFVSTAKSISNINAVETGEQKPVGSEILLTKNNLLIARFILSDEINPTAQNCLNQLEHQGVQTELLSGDTETACADIARQLGIDSWSAGISPESKSSHLELLTTSGKKTLMVGDGINDIGAFNQADVSISMGKSSHLSKAKSDIVLLNDELNLIPFAIRLSKRLDSVIRQNLTWAVVYNLTAIPFAAAGLVPAWLAAIGMTASSIVVVLNALRLRKTEP